MRERERENERERVGESGRERVRERVRETEIETGRITRMHQTCLKRRKAFLIEHKMSFANFRLAMMVLMELV